MYNIHNLEDYKKAIELRKRFGLGSTKISSFLLKQGYPAYRIGKILDFPYTNVYDFIKQDKRADGELNPDPNLFA